MRFIRTSRAAPKRTAFARSPSPTASRSISTATNRRQFVWRRRTWRRRRHAGRSVRGSRRALFRNDRHSDRSGHRVHRRGCEITRAGCDRERDDGATSLAERRRCWPDSSASRRTRAARRRRRARREGPIARRGAALILLSTARADYAKLLRMSCGHRIVRRWSSRCCAAR